MGICICTPSVGNATMQRASNLARSRNHSSPTLPLPSDGWHGFSNKLVKMGPACPPSCSSVSDTREARCRASRVRATNGVPISLLRVPKRHQKLVLAAIFAVQALIALLLGSSEAYPLGRTVKIRRLPDSNLPFLRIQTCSFFTDHSADHRCEMISALTDNPLGGVPKR